MARIVTRRCDVCKQMISELDLPVRLYAHWRGLMIYLAAESLEGTTAQPVEVDWCHACQHLALAALAQQ